MVADICRNLFHQKSLFDGAFLKEDDWRVAHALGKVVGRMMKWVEIIGNLEVYYCIFNG